MLEEKKEEGEEEFLIIELFALMIIIMPFLLLPDAAYSDTLKVYHGWVVKGIFAVSSQFSSCW